MYISSCLSSLIWSGLLVTSRCILSLCLVLSCLDVIKDYYLSLRPRLRVLVPPCCVHCDRRLDLNSKRRPFTSFCFVRLLKSFYLFLCFVCPAAWKSPLVIPTLAHCKSAWEFGGIAASPLTASPHARRSREISQARRLVPGLPLPQARRSREITPPARL